MDIKRIEELKKLCKFSYNMDGENCTEISFHNEDEFGSTIRRSLFKKEIIRLVSLMPALKMLNLRKSKLGYIPEMDSRELEFVDLSCNDLESVPDWVTKQRKLRFLNLGANKLKSIPDISELPLEVLKVHKNIEIESLPKMGDRIKTINLFLLPKIKSIPKDVFDLPLESLAFGVTEMKHLHNLASLPLLKWLILVANQMESIPDDICDLNYLEGLWLSKNKLERLPEKFGNLKSLKILALYSNKLTHLPNSFYDLNLKKLNIAKNPLSDKEEIKLRFQNIEFFRI